MWRPMTEKDFPNLMETIKEINDGEWVEDIFIQPFDLHIEFETDNDTNYVRIVDYNEELTWDGLLTEIYMEKLNNALKKDTDDSAYFEPIQCSEWSADWEKGRSRYDEESLGLDIHIGILQAISDYIDDNGIESCTWTDEQVKSFEDAYKNVKDVCMDIINSWKEH